MTSDYAAAGVSYLSIANIPEVYTPTIVVGRISDCIVCTIVNCNILTFKYWIWIKIQTILKCQIYVICKFI